VIICGRNVSKLEEAKHQIPGLVTLTCDVSSEKDRAALATRVASD
jgi:short-subunit dehydrogenase involved in D-alanine esterification of teichoic acids